MTDRPNSTDYNGPYNVPGSEFTDIQSLDFADYPKQKELNAVTESLLRIQKEIKKKQNINLGIHAGFDDRTAFVEFFDAKGITRENLEALQKTLTAFPQWRIFVKGSTRETSIIIYHDGLSFPNRGQNESDEIERIRILEVDFQDSRVGVGKRQLEFVRHRLRLLAIPEIPFEPIPICSFTTYKGDTRRCVVWCIVDGYPHKRGHWFPTEQIEGGWLGQDSTKFDLTRAGELVESLTSGKQFAGYLTCNIYDANGFRNRIEFCNPQSGVGDSLEIEELLDDADVRVLLSREINQPKK